MAHECPECGLSCHCGGDIDDMLLNNDRYVHGCSHCWNEDEPYDLTDDEDWDDEGNDPHVITLPPAGS